MSLLLVRHAKARSRKHWRGDDRDRPLTEGGWDQARRLVDLLCGYEPRRILSSPFVRCVQTVEPLVKKLGVDLELAEELGEGNPEAAVELLRRRAGEGVAVCTHGDVVPAVLDTVASDGVPLSTTPEWPKGSTWVLGWDGYRFSSASYLEPPSD